MIVAMSKAYIVAGKADRDRLLAALGRLGVVHLKPVEAARAVADAETVAVLDRLNRAIQVLEAQAPAGQAPALSAADAAQEVLRIQRESAERNSRLSLLHRQIEQLALWGDVRIEQLQALAQAGVDLKFFAVPRALVGQFRAECVHQIAPWPGKRVLVAVIQRGGEAQAPEDAEPVPLPDRDRPTLRAEAAAIDAALRADAERLTRLAHLLGDMQAERARLRAHAAWTVATRSALDSDRLYALQGWVPADKAAHLAADLRAEGVEAAVEAAPADPGEEPPTLLRYPWWARPMEGLFKILGTVPGYTEFDVSAMFMIFLPVFSAILISDTGYGLIYLLAPLIFYRKMAAAGAEALAQLVIVIGACSVIWGVLTGSFFGFNMCEWPVFGRVFPQPVVAIDMKKESMDFLMLLSITLGAVHLILAHLWKAKAAFPGLAFLSELGWCIWLVGMYGLVGMFLLKSPFAMGVAPYYPWWLIVGGALAILFAAPDKNPLKMIGLGLANFPLSAIGTFGDTVSYVRLMAIGLAGGALALAFNSMGASLPWWAMIPVLAAGHALNVALSIISIFAHGVRLNMLEFSNNLGMQWSGYLYEPFSKTDSQEN